MIAAERRMLFDAAICSRDAPACLGGMQAGFGDGDHRGDAVIAAVLRALIQGGEIETVMRMKAEWSGQRKPDQLFDSAGP